MLKIIYFLGLRSQKRKQIGPNIALRISLSPRINISHSQTSWLPGLTTTGPGAPLARAVWLDDSLDHCPQNRLENQPGIASKGGILNDGQSISTSCFIEVKYLARTCLA
jgi:hypothetical protein